MRKSDLILPDYPIYRGNIGLNVSRLQACFDVLYKLKGKKKLQSIEPAYLGFETQKYILIFQTENNIKITGYYDRLTRQKLREVLQCR